MEIISIDAEFRVCLSFPVKITVIEANWEEAEFNQN